MSRPSALERLATHSPSILNDIAFHLAVDPFLGPPTNLFSLLLTCRTLYNHLSIADNSRLYARIFQHKFDYGAIERRLSPRWASAPCLARELRSRFVALKHIKHGNPSLSLDREALWKAYLMLLENDGRNEEQLSGWANLPDWVVGVVALRSSSLSTNTALSMPYLSDLEGMSLAVWLLWMTSSIGEFSLLSPFASSDGYPERVTTEPVTVRTALTNAIVPFIVRGYQYPSVFAPDTYFYLPTCEEHDIVGFSGPPPLVTQIQYLGHKLKLAVPPLTSAALLNFVVRQEAWQAMAPLPPRIADLPATRAEVATRNLGAVALTQEDVREFHYHTRTRFFQRGQDTRSEQLDRDWFRLVACHTTSAVERPLKGVVYSLGTLVGNWSGRIFVPDLFAHLNAVRDRRIPAVSVSLVQERISCFFEEHHCLSFSEPLLAPSHRDGLGEDIFNAWLPRDLEFTRRTDGLEIFDHSTGKNTWYETYHPERQSPYSTRTCERLSDRPNREWCRREDSGTTTQEDAEEGDEYEDYVEELPSGVQDIIITGQTCERQGEAWGYHSYIGRIRPWDGLVVFLRIPMHNQYRSAGRWIFKGYVHERTLVGRWRDTATDEHAVGFEGGFVLCQEDGTNTASMVA